VSRPTARAIERKIDQDPAGVCGWAVHAADPRPAFSDLQERLLYEILGFGKVPNDQIRGPQQAVGFAADETIEVGSAVWHLIA
jgi:hypothetical protein